MGFEPLPQASHVVLFSTTKPYTTFIKSVLLKLSNLNCACARKSSVFTFHEVMQDIKTTEIDIPPPHEAG